MDKPLICIVGPTASGKSALAMLLAQQYDGELVCADSRTVYRGMDIGTAKPNAKERKKVQHHLLDIVEPGEPFTAAQFKRLAVKTIGDIRMRNKLPILVGGTGLYVDAVIFDYAFGTLSDPQQRKKLATLSVEELRHICRSKNVNMPINHKNKRHLIRAIELGGLYHASRSIKPNIFVVGISTDREILRSRITKRVQDMVKAGVVREVVHLGEKYGWNNEAMSGNSYRIFKDVIMNSMSEQEAIEALIKSDMKLAKRQMTWLRRNPYIIWGQPTELLQEIKEFIAKS